MRNPAGAAFFVLLSLVLPSGLSSCGVSGTPPGAIVGRANRYDYSPSVIQTGSLQQFWWCGQAHNPENPNQDTDTILYESINTSTHQASAPVVVLAETPNSWDSAYVCNPKVVRGKFVNPLGDGHIYTYAMYYAGTASIQGVSNSIGAAFSLDGINWVKYPQPVIRSNSSNGYGAAQPTVWNSDQNAGIWIFYEDSDPTNVHIEATSVDGLHFTVQGTITTNGIDPNNPQPSWGDLAYDSSDNTWYATFNLPLRNPTTTGFVNAKTTGDNLEHCQYGVQLYKISGQSLLSGSTPWQMLKTVDTNATGYECNFIAGLLRDQYGNTHIGSPPGIELYSSISNIKPGWDATVSQAGASSKIESWDIGYAAWSPSDTPIALNRYYNYKVHEVTTGWIDPNGGFVLESTVGHLYEAPQNGATTPFYGCKSGAQDYFVSLDPSCEGARILGLSGYGYSQLIPGMNLLPLYRCSSGQDHFLSSEPTCEGEKTEELLGYALP